MHPSTFARPALADKDVFNRSANLMTSMGRLFAILDPQMDIKTCTEIL